MGTVIGEYKAADEQLAYLRGFEHQLIANKWRELLSACELIFQKVPRNVLIPPAILS